MNNPEIAKQTSTNSRLLAAFAQNCRIVPVESINRLNEHRKTFLCSAFLLPMLLLTASAQLAVTVSQPKIIGQKAMVKLAIKNGLPQKIESARAVCFLLDDQGKLIAQSTKWVIGQNKTGLAPGATNSFNFVITNPHPFNTTNLTAKISFSRVAFEGGKLTDMRQQVTVTPQIK